MSELDFTRKAGIPAAAGEGDDTTAAAAGGPGAAGEGVPMRSPLADGGTRRGEDELERSLRPKTLDEFIGQRRVREQLGVFIDAAGQRDEALDHALFAGPPGLGKCVTPDTLLFTTHGMVPIGELGELGGESWQPITRPMATLYGTRTADWFYDNGPGATLRVTTDSGYRVEGTPNHPLLVRGRDGQMRFSRLAELRSGDEVAVRLGAGVFGSTTTLHVEGIGMPSLQDPASVPGELTPQLARLLGLLLNGGRISPGGEGVVFTSRDESRVEELRRSMHEVLCLELEEVGEGPFGTRWAARSPRVARFFEAMGLRREGLATLPPCIYRAPRPHVAEFLRGVFWGVEHAPAVRHAERPVISHLQLFLANFGIHARIAPVDGGWSLRADAEPSATEGLGEAQLAQLELAAVGQVEHAHSHGQEPPEAAARARTMARAASGSATAGASPQDRPMAALAGSGGSLADERTAGFGMTAAGVLVAVDEGSTEYRRGAGTSDDLVPVQVHPGERVRIEPGGDAVSVAEVDPGERGYAVVRDRLPEPHHHALAVRSVRSRLEPDEMVELAWEPVASIEPGSAHTVDVSVPDGHTFVGNGIVCHNTTLASVMATELGSTMHATSGPALEKKADVAAILTSLGPRDVLFIDEIHRLGSAIEEVLYTAMEDYQIDIVLGQGPAARTLRLELEPFTLVGATTRTGLLTTPLRDRFGITQRLEYYDQDELTDIVRRSARLLEIEIDDEAAVELAMRSRGTPRIANRLLRRVRDVAQVRHGGEVTLEVAREALDLVDIDGAGLDRIDRQVLETILVKFGGGPVGLNTLAVAIGEEPHTIEDVYEPYLLQQGFLQRTPRGRIVTERGRQHLGAAGVQLPPRDAGGLF